MSCVKTVSAFAVLALLSLGAFADSFNGTLSEVAKAQYETALPYDQILKKDFSAESFNNKIRFQIEVTGFSSKPLANPYAQLLTKSSNSSLLFKGLQPNLPLFVNDAKGIILKKIEKLSPGDKVFAYATFSYALLPVPKKAKAEAKNAPVAYLLLDDILLPSEELAMDQYREKFGKGKDAAKTPAKAPEGKKLIAETLIASEE